MKPYFSILPIDKIVSNNNNYIRDYTNEDIDSLANSIRRFGLIEPLIVKKRNIGYLIICGERRFRACKRARLQKIPSIITSYSAFQSNTINFSDNYHIKSMNYIEKYIAVKSYMENWNLNIKECSDSLNLNSYYINDILSLSKLSERQFNLIKSSSLTEEQVKLALKISSDEEREKFLNYIIYKKFNTLQTKDLYEKISKSKSKKKDEIIIAPDLRFILNTINKAVETMKKNGIEVDCKKSDNSQLIECNLYIKKPISNVEKAGNYNV